MKKAHTNTGQPKALAIQFSDFALDVCKYITTDGDLSGLFNLIAKEGARLLNAQGASILLLDQEHSELWSQSTVDGEVIRFDSRLGIAGAAISTGEIINVPDAQQDQRFYTGIDTKTKKHTRSLLAVPLKTPSGQIVGVFEALNKKGGLFTPQDEAMAQALATQAALPLQTTQMVRQLQIKHRHLQEENNQLWKEVEGRFATQNLIGHSPRMQSMVRLIDQISDSSVDVLITGENGTGKELVAKAIHYNSPRARRPFIALNAATLPHNLVEAELFGIEKGIATGVEHRIGKFEQANKGTLFMDEIGDFGISAQAKILRVLQERVLERVGGQTNIPLDVRIIAATNKDLQAAIKNGVFREDLYFRLHVVHIQTPSLREIPDDIPLLANFFLSRYCEMMGKTSKKFSEGILRCFRNYSWPGNVRQLENEIKRLVVTVRRTTILEEDLDEIMRVNIPTPQTSLHTRLRSLPEAVAEFETRLIREALLVCRSNQVQTAKRLGLSRQGLIKKMKRYGIVQG
ncbi:MAG: GAF domain-containing protein [Nitrospirales bacterium]|nr:GAF domain-containing protein [Nitrospirales bacterium]